VGWEELNSQIRAFRDFPDLDVAHPGSAVMLYGWLVEPLRAHLTTTHLAIVPHSVLHYLPLAALTDGQRYVVDDYVITYLPSTSALKFIRTSVGGESGSPLILGNPDTDDPNLTPLTSAKREVQAIAILYNVQPLLDEAATESAVWERATEAGLLHLAAHGGYNSYNPLYSAIALAPTKKTMGGWKCMKSMGWT
jgi:CHAT domain-containing protein